MYPPIGSSISVPTSHITRRKFACRIRGSLRTTSGSFPECQRRCSSKPGAARWHSTPSGLWSTPSTVRSARIELRQESESSGYLKLVSQLLTRQPTTPAENRLGAIASGALPHDMLDVHFDGVFRKIQFCGNQLVGKTEFQCCEHVLLARREVDYSFLHRIFRDVSSQDHRRRLGLFGAWRPIVSDDWKRSVDPAGENKTQAGDSEFDRDRGREEAADTPMHRRELTGFVITI